MKKICLLSVFIFMTVCIFADPVEKLDSGKFQYSTTISSLVNRKIDEEIQVQNNSSFTLSRLSCTVVIGNKSHDMKVIQRVKPGDDEEFEGYEDDEMNDEFPYYFGEAGKFRKDNHSEVTFIISFKEHADLVEILDVYEGDDSLVFVVTDSEKASKQIEKSFSENNIEIFYIEGKPYAKIDGKLMKLE